MSQEIEKVWPEWKVESQIGKGAFGSVYKAVRTDHGLTSTAAIKVLHIPQDEAEVTSLRSEGLDLNGTRTYLQGIVDDFVGEIKLMESLKGVQNIVSVEDYQVVERQEELGWDIYIRMELLTPFDVWICSHKMDEKDVIRLGIDLCTALELCEKRNVIHRDIKPANIFVNDFGFFKLGDFGIARKLESTSGNLSKKGTYNYMAPEVARGSSYDSRVDIYSLGIVLYRLLNENRLPFLSNEQLMDPNARKEALERRLRGDALPPPKEASPAMANLILCACAYEPDRRFRTASAMKAALQCVLNVNKAAQTAGQAGPEGQASARAAASAKTAGRTVSHAKPAEQSHASPKTAGRTASGGQTPSAAGTRTRTAGQKETHAQAAASQNGRSRTAEKTTPHSQPGRPADREPTRSPKTEQKPQKKAGKTAKEPGKGGTMKKILFVFALIAAAGLCVLGLSRVMGEKGEDIPVIGGVIGEINAESIRKENVETTLADAEAAADAQDYQKALSILAAGLLQYPDEEQFADKQAEYQALLDQENKQAILEEAETYAGAGDYESALKTIRAAIEENDTDADYLSRVSDYAEKLKNKALAAADQYAENQEYLKAYQTARDALDAIGSDTELNVKTNLYEQNYVEDVLAQVDGLVQAKDYSSARSILDAALKNVPDNQDLTARRNEINALQPVSLSSVSVLNGGWTWNDVAPEDPFGNDYSSAMNYAVFQKRENTYYDSGVYEEGYGNYAEYRVYGKYSTLTMTLAPYKEIGENCSVWVQVYADDMLVQTSPRITRKTDAMTLNVPIANAEYIKIVVNLSEDYPDYGALIMSNVQLWP